MGSGWVVGWREKDAEGGCVLGCVDGGWGESIAGGKVVEGGILLLERLEGLAVERGCIGKRRFVDCEGCKLADEIGRTAEVSGVPMRKDKAVNPVEGPLLKERSNDIEVSVRVSSVDDPSDRLA